MNLTIAITGASGAIFGREMLRVLEADERVARVHFVASENSLRVMAEELGLSGRTGLLEKLLGGDQGKTEQKNPSATESQKPSATVRKKTSAHSKIVQHANSDIGAAIASGSYPSNGMIVLPCSMGTLADCERPGQLADRTRRRCHAEGAAAADLVRARDAIQSHSSAQHDAGSGGRSHDFPVYSCVL